MSSNKSYSFRKVKCNICGGDNTIYLGKRILSAFALPKGLAVKVVKCKNCGLIYANPMPFPNGEQLKQNYASPDEYFPADITERRLNFYNSILKEISRYVKIGKLLDVGCGRGELIHVAHRLGWTCWGVDVSSQFVEIARRRFKLNNIILGTLQDARFPEGFFNVVTSSSVLEFVDDPRSLVDEIQRVMRKGGILYLEDTNDDGLLFLAGDLAFRLMGRKRTTRLYLEHPKYQRYGFTPRSIEKLLNDTGFEILDMRIGGDVNSPEPEFSSRLTRELVNFVRRLIIRLGIQIGRGHLLTIYARKIDQTQQYRRKK